MSIYNLKANTIGGKEISFEDYKGKTLIIVNTASKCGLTPQFDGLEKIYKEFTENLIKIEDELNSKSKHPFLSIKLQQKLNSVFKEVKEEKKQRKARRTATITMSG